MGNKQVQAALEVGYATDAGSRDNQEDSLGFRQYDDGSVLAVLADGMGGHAGGEVASELAVRWFGDHFPQTTGSITTRLEETLQYTQRQLCRHAEGKPALQGMGSTLVAVFVHNREVHWVSVGDSLLYRLWQGKLEKLNAEHNVQARFRRLRENGRISPAEYAQVQNPYALTSALGPDKLHEVDSNQSDLPQDAVLILASDGLLTLEQADIVVLLTVQASAQRLADRLLRATLAQHAPGQDNIGLVVIKPPMPVPVAAGRAYGWVGLGMVLVLGASAGLLYQLYQADQQARQERQARAQAEQIAQQERQARALAEQQAQDARQDAEKSAQAQAEETRRADKAEQQKQAAERSAKAERKARQEAEAKARQETQPRATPPPPVSVQVPPAQPAMPPPLPPKDVVPELDKNTVLP